jgi:hypothetical protein
MDVRSEAEFDHLLGAILTHAAMRAGGSLPGVVGSALGGLLKSIARQGLSRPAAARALGLELEGLDRNEREFEAAIQFVRLAAEAARHLAEEPMIAPSRASAHAALAAASDIYAPPMLSAFAPYNRRSEASAHPPSPIGKRGVARSAFRPEPIGVWVEAFEYDPEMEYFLGGLVRKAGRAIGNVARAAGKVAGTVGKIPILGDIARAVGAVGAVCQIDALRKELKLVEMVLHRKRAEHSKCGFVGGWSACATSGPC